MSSYPRRLKNFKIFSNKSKVFASENFWRKQVLSAAYGYLVQIWRIIGLPPKKIDIVKESRISEEARLFSGVLKNFSEYLSDKTLIIFESSGFGNNRAGFSVSFSQAIRAAGLSNVIILDSYAHLNRSDYYYIDDHLTPEGHIKVSNLIVTALDKLVSD